MKIKSNSFTKILRYLALFGLMFLTDGGYSNYSFIGYYAKIIGMFILTIFILIPNFNIVRHFNRNLFLAIVVIVVSGFINSSSVGVFAAYIAMMVFSYCFTKAFDFQNFADMFVALMRFLAVISLLLYIVVVFMPSLRSLLPVVEYTYNVSSPVKYYDIGFSHLPVLVWQVQRNYGPFWEPGVFQVYINLALLLSVFRSPSKTLWRDVILFGITIVTTFSTTGYISFCLVLLCLLFVRDNKLGGKWKVFFGVLLAILIGVSIFSEQLYDYVFFKLGSEGSNNGSFISRTASIIGNLILGLKNPLLGVGYSNSAVALNELYAEIYIKQIHQTNTITNYFASYGLFVGVFFTFLWGKVARFISNNSKLLLLVFITLFLMLSGENMVSSVCVNIFMLYGLECDNRGSWLANKGESL